MPRLGGASEFISQCPLYLLPLCPFPAFKMSKRGEVLTLEDPSPSVVLWQLALPAAAAVGSWGDLLCSRPERAWRVHRESTGRAPESDGAGWRVELAGSSRDSRSNSAGSRRVTTAVTGLKLD